MAKLEFDNVSKIYNQGRPAEVAALDEVSLSVEEGDYAAIMGPSGSGKTTALHIAGMLDVATSGEMYYEGEPASELSDKKREQLRSREIGFVFQNIELLSDLTVEEQVELPLCLQDNELKQKDVRQRVNKCLSKVALESMYGRYPDELSGGQKQRTAIARALASTVGMILADEPTGALDKEKSAAEVLDIFGELNADGRTLIVVTHDQEVSNQAERVIYLCDGHVEHKETT